jgi:hypothetical protein
VTLTHEPGVLVLNAFRQLEQVNNTEGCVYLGENGCMWRISPISCVIFLCEQARRTVFGDDRSAEATWEQLRMQEQEYTRPTKPVLFDDLERYFISLGVDSPHMYFHKSLGLLRLKARSGLEIQTAGQSSVKTHH